ncbi:uncharacterized protein LOC103277824 [Anolis carolinensis]|uniref:uncharacterized protein LOC103277824 n=1 Tax=Anolis carolinensis TaxID=28377 RepID=UPI002F2B5F6F
MALVGGRGREGPKPPDPPGGAPNAAFLKALEAVVAAGKRGLLGPAALAAAERVPELSPRTSSSVEGNSRGVSQEVPGPVPLNAQKKKKKKQQPRVAMAVNAHLPDVTSPQKEIWICGNSVVLASEKRAKNSLHGLQLGIPASRAHVYWHGRFAMKWEHLLLVLCDIYHKRPSPSVLIIHLGEDDLLPSDNFSLLMSMKNDLDILRKAFPDTVIIWSSLLPRCGSKKHEKTEHMEKALKEINTRMADYCNKIDVHFLSHSSITSDKTGLFLPNLTALSDAGADIFIEDVQTVLRLYELFG